MTDLSNIPAQSQQWPGTDAALTPAADHGETSWTPRGRLTGKRAPVSYTHLDVYKRQVIIRVTGLA